MPAGLLPPLVLELRARAGQVRSELGGVRNDVRKLDEETAGGLSKTQRASSSLATVGKGALLSIAGGAALAGAASLKMGISYQESTTRLVTGAGESEKSIGMVRDGMLGLAGKVGVVPEQLSQGMYLIESAGYHAASGLKVLQSAAEGAKIGGADMTTVADGLTTALTDYHIPASKAAVVTSQLVSTVAAGKTTMGALAGSLHNVLPAAAAAHLGLAQVLGAMSTMTGQGISADQASQDLAATLRSLQNPSHEQAAEMEALGVNSTNLAKNLGKNGLTGTLDILTQAIASHTKGGLIFESTLKKSEAAASDARAEFGKLPASLQPVAKQFMAGTITAKAWRKDISGMTVDQKQLAQQFASTVNDSRGFNDLVRSGSPQAKTFAAALSKLTGGATGMNTALALTGANAATFKSNVKGIGSASAEAGGHVKGWAVTQKDLATQIAQAKATVIALATKIGVALIPYVEKAIHVVSSIVSWFGKHSTVAKVLAGVIGGVLVLAMANYVAGLVKAKVQSAIQFGEMVAGWLGLGPAAETAATVTATAGAEIAATSEATGAATTTAFGPIGLAVAAIGVAIMLLATHWKQVWGAIKAAVSAAWNDVIKPVFGFIKQHWGLVFAVVTGGLTLIIQHWKQVWGAAKTVYDDVVKPVFDFLKDHWKLVVEIVTGGLALLITHWHQVWGAVKAVYDAVIAPVFHAIGDVATGAWNTITRIGARIASAWSSVWNGLKSTVVNIVHDIGTVVSGIFSGVKSGIADVINGGISIINSAIKFINNDLIDTANEVPFVNIPHIPTIPPVHFAMGGSVGNGWFVTGENGPELGFKSGPSVRMFSNARSFTGAGALAAGGASSGGSHGGGGVQVIEVHSHLMLDGKEIYDSVERHALRTGMRRGQSYQNYTR